jgi:hypothetical protein
MEHVLFFLFSFLEFAAGLAFVLALFRFDFVEYRTHILYSGFILTEISYLLRMGFDLEPISLIVQMVSLIVMFILLYQFPIFSSIIIGTVGYILFGLLQMLIQVFLTILTPLSLSDLYKMGYVIQTLTAAAGFMAAGLARRMRIGVGFLPRQQSDHLHFDTENVLIFSIMVITVLTILTYSIFQFDQVMMAVVLMVLLLVQILLLIYLANRKVKRSD